MSAITAAGAARGVAGAAVAELGCGSGYVSAWLARRGARPDRVDVSARQLATARRLQDEFGLHFPLIQGDAGRVPLSTGCADLVISEYVASAWFDPSRWIPEAARLLRPGGQLVFMAQSMLARMCMPEQGPASDRLVRPVRAAPRGAAWHVGPRLPSCSRSRTGNGSGSWLGAA